MRGVEGGSNWDGESERGCVQAVSCLESAYRGVLYRYSEKVRENQDVSSTERLINIH